MKGTIMMLPEDLKMLALKHANMMEISLGGLIRESKIYYHFFPMISLSIPVDQSPFFRSASDSSARI